MTTTKLILRSLIHHARSHAGVLLGAIVGSAVLVGALLVGDSVRHSLREMALARLGKTHDVLVSNDRLFRAELAAPLSSELNEPTAPVLIFLGTAAARGGEARANQVQVAGVDQRFWTFAQQAPELGAIPEDTVVLNSHLARQLGVSKGDSMLLRVPQPSQLSRDAPMAPEEDSSIALRVEVHAIVDDSRMGRFSLQASQLAPFNAFLPLEWLQQKLDAAGRANLILIGGSSGNGDSGAFVDDAARALEANWTLADAELELVPTAAATNNAGWGALELRTDRVFLDPTVAEPAMKLVEDPTRILTYFVNELRLGENATPYSMVTAAESPLVPEDLGNDQIVLNQWLADDLGAAPGDKISVRYFVIGDGRKTEERTNSFTVHSIVPLEGSAADPTLMPAFPGLKDAENCREWDTGFNIDLDTIRDKDNQYWEDHKGTPKAFITLDAGQRMWANRFGNLTAIRFNAPPSQIPELGAKLLDSLDPAEVGLVLAPVRQQALTAVDESQDFGGLFIGFSFFLIVAALLLMSLLFQFGIEQRAREIGTLLALGFRPAHVRRLLLGEGALIAVMGGVIGMFGGMAYAKAMLRGLTTLWKDAVGTSSLTYHAQPATLAIGAVASVVVALLTIWIAVRKHARQPARKLLSEGAHPEAGSQQATGRGAFSGWIALGGTAIALALLGWSFSRGDLNPGLFFGAGALLLISGLAVSARLISRLDRPNSGTRLSLTEVGLRNSARRHRRSLATVAMLACGSFLVVAVGANKLDALKAADQRSSGTGGFAFFGETTLPVVHDLNTRKGWEQFGLLEDEVSGIGWVPFRVREGEEASCLNLNRAQRPRIIAADPEALASRDAFTFAKVAKGHSTDNPWRLLNEAETDDAIPAIADINVILWALGRKVGEVFELPDPDEQGRPIRIKLVAGLATSIMQGSLIISEKQFVKRFPNEEGYRMFLVDAPSNGRSETRELLTKGLEDAGLELTLATRRMADFNAVQNTYLSTFQILGGLGLLLGSIGLGVVVLRNVLERRSELALLLALGFRRQSVRWIVVSEHGALLLLGLATGVIAALIAVLPAVLSPGAATPWLSLSITLAAVLASGALWTWISTVIALKGHLLEALRNE